MLNKFPKEILTISFYSISILFIYLGELYIPSGVCNPGLGFMLFLLFIPTSIVYFFIQLFNYLKGNSKYRNCLFLHLLIWVVLLLFLIFNK